MGETNFVIGLHLQHLDAHSMIYRVNQTLPLIFHLAGIPKQTCNIRTLQSPLLSCFYS